MSWVSDIEPLSARNMRYFVALVEIGSMRGAAERLNLSPVVLRSRMKALAKGLGFALLERSKTGLRLTSAGQQIYELCRESLDALDGVERKLKSSIAQGMVAGRVRFAIHPGLARTIMPAILIPLLDAHPGLEIVAYEVEGATMLSWLEEGAVDIVIGAPAVHHWWLTELAGIEEHIVLCSKKPLAFAPDEMAKLDLAGLDLDTHNMSASLPPLPEGLARDPAACRPLLKMNGLLAAIAIVRRTDWCSILPLTAVIDEVEAGTLFACPVAGGMHRLVVARHTERSLGDAAEALLAVLPQALESLATRSAALIARLRHPGGLD